MKSNDTIGCVILVCFCILMSARVGYGEDAASRPAKPKGRPYDELWKEEDVKKYLRLPYDARETSAESLSFERFKRLTGIGKFAVVSDRVEVCERSQTSLGGVFFTLSGPDLSLYSVDMFQPVSVKIACDWIFKHVTGSIAIWNDIPEYYRSERVGNMYILRTAGRPRESLYFDAGRMIMLRVRYEHSYELGNKQYSVMPSEKMLKAQMDQIVDGMIAVVTVDEGAEDKKKSYEEIKQAYRRVSCEPTVPADARRLVLRLSPVDQNVSAEKTSSMLRSEVVVVELHKPYILRDANGQAVAVGGQKRTRNASSASSGEVSSEATSSKSSDRPATITTQESHTAQSQLQIRAESADVAAQPDGSVRVVFRRVGKRTVKVFYFGEEDRVIAFGELTVDVQPAKKVAGE